MRRSTARWGAAGVAFALGLAALSAQGERREAGLDPAAAVRAALSDSAVRAHLREYPHDETVVSALEDGVQRVSFFDGARLVLDAAVTEGGRVRAIAPRYGGKPPTGHELSHEWVLWVAWSVALVVLLAPAGMRRADAAVVLLFPASAWAYNEGLVAATVWIAAPLLVWLALRCAQVGFGAGRPAAPAGQAGGGVARLVALGVGAAALLLTLTSTGESDVAFASTAGATLILDGVLPYGNMPADVVHGDTYPFLNYVVHIPVAVWQPVRDSFSDLTGGLVVAAAALMVCAAGLHRIGSRLWGGDWGWRLAGAWLAFPPTVMSASSGSNDILLAAGVAWMVALLALPAASMAVLAAAAWIKLVPLAMAPLWLARVHGRRGRAMAAAVAVSLPLVVWLLVLDGPGALGAMAEGVGYQSERGSLFSVWAQIDAPLLQDVFQAATLALIAAGSVALLQDRRLAGDPVRVAGLLGAVLLAVQIAANYWTFAYLPWAMPCVLLALFGPVRR